MSETQFDAMEYIWEKLPKSKDGKTVRYSADDIPYLYENGFVDTQRFTMEQWKNAFEFYKQPDGSFVLNKEAFMLLRVFRWVQPVREAFNPERLREGAWQDDELQYLFLKSVKPSSTISEEIYWTAIKSLKKFGNANENGELIVDAKVKKQLAYLLDKFPSPRRKLQKEVERLNKEKDNTLSLHQRNRDASQFVIGKSKKENELESFKKLEGAAQSTTASAKASSETIDLKALKKPKPTFRG